MNKWKNIFSDREFWFILIFNICLAWGFNNAWLSMDTVIWIYFFQSVIIGISNVIRIASLKKFTSDNFQINGESVQPTSKTKWTSSIFFAFHYGFFHFIYFIFLIVMTAGNQSKLDIRVVFINIGIMATNAIFSTWSNIVDDRDEKPAIGTLFFTPYLRVLPMHIFIILGMTRKMNASIPVPIFGMLGIFYIFLILKSFSDLIMHVIIEKTWRGPRTKAIGGYI